MADQKWRRNRLVTAALQPTTTLIAITDYSNRDPARWQRGRLGSARYRKYRYAK